MEVVGAGAACIVTRSSILLAGKDDADRQFRGRLSAQTYKSRKGESASDSRRETTDGVGGVVDDEVHDHTDAALSACSEEVCEIPHVRSRESMP